MIRHFYGLVISKFGASFQRFLHNFAAHGFGQVVNVLAQLVLLPAFLHYWTTTEYGEWLVIVSIPSLLWTLDNGLSGLAANRMTVASGMGDWKAANLIFHNVLLIQGTLSLIILTLAGIFVSVVNVHAMFGFSRFEHLTTSHVTEVLMTRQQAGEVLFIMIAQMLMGYGLGLSRAAYRASMLEARGVAITNMERLTYFCSVVLVLTLHGQTVAVAWAMLASTTFWLLFSYTDIRRRCPHITFAFGPLSRVQLRAMTVDGLPVMAGTAASAFFLQGYLLIVNSILGPAAVVMLNVIRTASRSLLQLVNMVANASGPELSRTYGSRDWEGYLRLLKVLLAVTVWISLAVGVGLAVAGPWVVEKLSSGRVLVQHPIMVLFAVSVACQAGWAACGSVLYATNMHHVFNYAYFFLTVLGLAAAEVVVRLMGFPGVPMVMMTVDAMLLAWALYLCHRKLSFVPLGSLLCVFSPPFYFRKINDFLHSSTAAPRDHLASQPERVAHLKILAISHMPNDENAGASRIYHLLAQGLRERGHTVKLLHYEDLKVPSLLSYWGKRIALPELIDWRFFREAASGYDVVFASNGVAHRIFRRLRRRAKRPKLVHHLHGSSYLDFEAIMTERSRGHVKYSRAFMAFKSHYASSWDVKGAQEADVVVTQSLRDEDHMNDRKELDRSGRFTAPVVRVPALLHPGIAEASLRAVPPKQRDPHSLLWFGTWGERKGSHYINRAFRKVKARHPQATLTLGGTGVHCEMVLNSFDPELRSSLHILPRIDLDAQLAEFNRHSIFLFPSLSEGFGLALVEAMAMGLACVTTSTGMMGDWITDQQEALLIPVASAEHLANAVLRLMEDDALRCRVATAGQELARSFTLDRFVQGYLDVFEATQAVRNGH
jgi:glycosyltransferase involved in cell wall biosynthesis/O-antigen/teichoic acid export membrane protein